MCRLDFVGLAMTTTSYDPTSPGQGLSEFLLNGRPRLETDVSRKSEV